MPGQSQNTQSFLNAILDFSSTAQNISSGLDGNKKFELLQSAKEMAKLASMAKDEVKQLSDAQKDQLTLQFGHSLFEKLEGIQNDKS